MHRGRVERIDATRDAQEARALFKGLGPQPRDVEQLPPRGERAVAVPMRDDHRGQSLTDPGHLAQQRDGRRVDIHADGVHAVLDHAVQTVRQQTLGDVVLVLAHPDRLRVDLHQLGQRVLQTAGDGDGPAQRDVQLRQLGRGIGGGRVHRCPGLADDRAGQPELGTQSRQFGHQSLGLPGRRPVADRDQLDAVFHRQFGQPVQRRLPLLGGGVRIDRVGRRHLAGSVDHRDLDPGAQSRVQTHRGPRTRRRGEQQVPQVLREHPNRLGLGDLAKPTPDVALHPQRDPGPPGPAHAVQQPQVGCPAGVGDPGGIGDQSLDLTQRAHVGVVRVEREFQDPLALPAEEGEHSVRRRRPQRLTVVEPVREPRRLSRFRLLDAGTNRADQVAARPDPLPQRGQQVGVLGEPFDQDRPGPIEGRVDVGDRPARC